MRSLRLIFVASGLLFLSGLGVALWALHAQRQANAAQLKWLQKEMALRSTLDRAQKKASAAAWAAADFDAVQALAKAKPKPASSPSKGPDVSALFLAHPELKVTF